MTEQDRQRFEDLRHGYERELKRTEESRQFWKILAYALAACLFLYWLFHDYRPNPDKVENLPGGIDAQ